MRVLIIAVIFSSFVMSGCTTAHQIKVGSDFNAEKRTQIIKKTSSREDVLVLYGEPTDKTLDENYNEKWEYAYTDRKDNVSTWDYSSKGAIRTKKLTIIFNEDGRELMVML